MKPKTVNIHTGATAIKTLVWGNAGRKVLLIHGFPETPHIFARVAEGLVETGYQVFAPFLPGYGPTSRLNPGTSITHLSDLAPCFGDLCHQICKKGETIILVGHDWGAIAAYVTAVAYPQLFSKMIVMAVPPLPVFLKRLFTHPRQWMRSSYILFFQLRNNIPERVITRNNQRFLKRLTEKWSGHSEPSRRYFTAEASPFDEIGNFRNPLGYYRGLVPMLSGSISKWLASRKLAFSKIRVPTRLMCGELDGCIPPDIFMGYENWFEAPADLIIVPGAGHFLPIDSPDAIIDQIR